MSAFLIVEDDALHRSFLREVLELSDLDCTVIVEAGETSGTLTQARAALQQGRKLFILDSCFERTDVTWPVGSGRARVRVHGTN